MIYLDNAATTYPKDEAVYLAMDKANRTYAFNAGRGSYRAARISTQIIDDTKQAMLNLFHATDYAEVVLTPSITHAFNQVLNGLSLEPDAVIYLTPYEHNAVARTVFTVAEKYGYQVEMIPLSSTLEIDLDKMEYQFSVKKPAVVVANAISNVTGYVLPVDEIFHKAKEYGALTIMDSAQAAGLLDIHMENTASDILCFAGHKTLCGPFGIGGFLLRKGITLKKILTGGTGSNSLNLDMPEMGPGRYEASSPNVVAISGLLAALKINNIESHYNQVLNLTQYLIDQLKTVHGICMPGVFTPGKTLGIVSFMLEGYQSDEIGAILDAEFDIAVRTGYHCAPYIHAYLRDQEYNGTVRVSIGKFNSEQDIDTLIEALETL